MANLHLGQDVANNRERKKTISHIVAKSYPLVVVVGMLRYDSLINPSDLIWLWKISVFLPAYFFMALLHRILLQIFAPTGQKNDTWSEKRI